MVSPEKTNIEAQNKSLEENFKQAHQYVTGLIQRPEFIQACKASDVDPYDDSDPKYWQQALELNREFMQNQLAANKIDEPTYLASELMFATPLYVIKQAELDSGNLTGGRNEAKAIASEFNSLIRKFAKTSRETSQEVSAIAVERGLQNVLNTTIYDDDLKFKGRKYLKDCIRGAKHELAFEQILQAANLDYRETDTAEDLKGADFVVNLSGHEVMLDVKASLSEGEAMGSPDKSFAYRSKDEAVIFSHVSDSEFRGNFFISNELASQKAPRILELLDSPQATMSGVV